MALNWKAIGQYADFVRSNWKGIITGTDAFIFIKVKANYTDPHKYDGINRKLLVNSTQLYFDAECFFFFIREERSKNKIYALLGRGAP